MQSAYTGCNKSQTFQKRFGESLRALPPRFSRFPLAVGLIGAGDFRHTMPILPVTHKLAIPSCTGTAAAIARFILRAT